MLVCPCWEVVNGGKTKRLDGGEAVLCKNVASIFFLFSFQRGGMGSIKGGVPFVSFHVGFSQRRFSENLFPPLATFPTTSLHHTTLVLICIRFTCPRCYSEGQEDGLVVPHADVGSNVVINY